MVKKREESEYSVILDTSFMIRLLSESDPLHSNAKGYFRYFLENNIPMYFSTVSIAEYCVKGDFYDLPFQECAAEIEHMDITTPYNVHFGLLDLDSEVS